MLLFERLSEDYVYVKFKTLNAQNYDSLLFSFIEKESANGVLSLREAKAHKMEYTFLCTVFQLTEHTALNAVGITAKVASALADKNIPCNVIAALHHDYFLVPKTRADEAYTILNALK